MDLKTSSLIESIKLSGSLPDGTFSNDDYVSFLNDTLISDLVPFMMQHREDFYSTYTDYPYSDVIAIPPRAIAQKLGDIVMVDSQGTILRNLPRVSIETISQDYRGRAVGFYLENNNIKFYPKGIASDLVRVYYFKRPHFITAETNCAKVLSVTSNDILVESIPSTWTTATVIDVPSSNQPYDISEDIGISGIDTVNKIITVNNASNITIGSYLCPKGFTVYPQIPIEAAEILVQGSIVKAMVSLKDINGAKMAGELLLNAKNTVSGLISPRVEGEVKKIVNSGGIFGARRSRNLWR